MEILSIIFFSLVSLIVLVFVTYAIIAIWFNDLSIPNLNIDKFLENKTSNVLVVYPHPDDELGMSGGLMMMLTSSPKYTVHAVSITKGEHGDELVKLPPKELGELRSTEYKNVMQVLGVKSFQLWDYIDGESTKQEIMFKKDLENFITKNNIHLVVTYEKLGLYGHPDHIVLSKVVNELSEKFNFKTLYGTLPDKILARIDLPKTLIYKDRIVELSLDKIANPEYKLHVGKYLFRRYKASNQYKSQNITQGKPLWLITLIANFEYYTSKYE